MEDRSARLLASSPMATLRQPMLTDSVLEALEHLVFDANEVVTYKWVSRKWQIHANLAKRLLHDFVAEQRRAGKSLCSWHAVLCAGSVTLVPEAKLARCLRRWPGEPRAHLRCAHEPHGGLERDLPSRRSVYVQQSAGRLLFLGEADESSVETMRLFLICARFVKLGKRQHLEAADITASRKCVSYSFKARTT
ncbi:hypothetical protein MTO96_020190 [Rhipicephalus appendiculatus]